MLSVEDRLEAADGEIERLRGSLDNAGGMVEQLRAENERLQSELAEAKKDADRLYVLLQKIYIDPMQKILRIDGLYLRQFGDESVHEMILRDLDEYVKGK